MAISPEYSSITLKIPGVRQAGLAGALSAAAIAGGNVQPAEANDGSAQVSEAIPRVIHQESQLQSGDLSQTIGMIASRSYHSTSSGNNTLSPHKKVKYKMPGWKPPEKPFPLILRYVAGCESGGNNPYGKPDFKAFNDEYRASGFIQIIPPTWDNFGGYDEAMDAPPRTQRWKAKLLYADEGLKPWYASRHCWGHLATASVLRKTIKIRPGSPVTVSPKSTQRT